MSYSHFYRQLETLARQTFPSLKESPPVAWDHLVSPLEVPLPRSVLTNAKAAIEALYRVSRAPAYAAMLEDTGGIQAAGALNKSVLMAYDFHTNEAGECFLVEVNTNASGFMLASMMEQVHRPIADGTAFAPWVALRESFAEEMRLSGRTGARIALTDEDLENQKMYAEFLMYRDWFGQQGWPAELVDSKQFSFVDHKLRAASGQEIGLVYNRLTDFYLEDPAHAALHDAYFKGAACLTPNPREYWLLADKQRLVQLTEPGFLERAGASVADREAIARVLIPTFEKSAFPSLEQIWAERRTLFFKPKRSYGGKSVYRGESVSKKVFERLMADDILIQKFQPAQRMPIDDPRSVLATWKFDLRFYVYGDQIQLIVARIYQGQVTNFTSPMGGFTSVRFLK